MSVHGDNTTPISNDGIAQLGPMVRSRVRVPARRTSGVQIMLSGVVYNPAEEYYSLNN